MKPTNAGLLLLFSRVMDELATEIDANYEDEEIGLCAAEHPTFLTFRRGLEALQARNVKLSRAMLHVQHRIEMAYEEHIGGDLPPLEDDD